MVISIPVSNVGQSCAHRNGRGPSISSRLEPFIAATCLITRHQQEFAFRHRIEAQRPPLHLRRCHLTGSSFILACQRSFRYRRAAAPNCGHRNCEGSASPYASISGARPTVQRANSGLKLIVIFDRPKTINQSRHAEIMTSNSMYSTQKGLSRNFQRELRGTRLLR